MKSIPVLRVDRISLTRGKPILKEVSFEVMPGEMVIVLGPSGSGKTSLLRCLNRLETADSGQIFLNEDETRSIPPEELRRRVGMVFQTSALMPGTIKENVAIGPRFLNQPMNDEKIDELLIQVGLPAELWDRQVEALSVGERQRVALAQVLANGPELLLLDEPTSALDLASVLKIEGSLQRVYQESKTAIILVTHNLEQAKRLETRTLLLIDGEVTACGNLRAIMRQSNNSVLNSYFNHRGKI